MVSKVVEKQKLFDSWGIKHRIFYCSGGARYFQFLTLYSLRLGVVSGRGSITLLAGSAFVYVELGAERPQRPLFLENTLKVETFWQLQANISIVRFT